MAMMPKRVKYRKSQRGVIRGLASRGTTVKFGEFGLMSLDPGWIGARQIEAGRVAATHFLGNEGKVYIRIFPHKPISAKPAETRMGTGKGEPEYYAAVIRPGMVLFEIGGIPEDTARQALNRIAHKLPLKTKLVRRRHEL
jgi:large subunit ribosomal protein L16